MVSASAVKRVLVSRKWLNVLAILYVVLSVTRSELCLPCPQECDCQEETTDTGNSCLVVCDDKDLPNFPEILPQNQSLITKLIIKENLIKKIPLDALENMTNVEYIDASNNWILDIPDYLFIQQANLAELNLLGNQLTKLNSASFAGLRNLTKLILTRNKFTHLPRGIFDELPSLKNLYINVMSVTTIDGGIFQRNSLLHTLFMNKLSLETLPHDLFSGSESLEIINLSANRLTTLPEGLFQNLTALRYISLENNPWHCDCELFWLTSWLSSKISAGLKENDRNRPTICQSPDLLKDTPINSLQKDKLNCGVNKLSSPRVDHFDWMALVEARSARFVRSSIVTRQHFTQKSKIWRVFCKSIGNANKVCTGPDLFVSCIITSGDLTSSEEARPIQFTTASYQSSKNKCLEDCFSLGLPFGNLHSSMVCFCGSLLTSCTESCTPFPGDNQNFCGKHYLPQTFVVSSGLSISPVGIINTNQVAQFDASTSIQADKYVWDFGDGHNAVQTTSGSVEFIYFFPGDYLLSVTVISGKGSESAKIPIQVRDTDSKLNLVCESPVDVTKAVNVSLTITRGFTANTLWQRENEQGAVSKALYCEENWLEYRGKCLQAFTSSRNYTEAQAECEKFKGKLLSLDYRLSLREISYLLNIQSASPPGYLIGATRSDATNNYVWTDSGQPAHVINNQISSAATEDCVAMYHTGFSAVSCKANLPYICQKGTSECSRGGTVGPDGQCYLIFTSPTTWDMANINCQQYPGGSLAVDDQDTVHRFISYSILGKSSESEAWIGLNDKVQEGYFTWTNGRAEIMDDGITSDENDQDDSAVKSTSKWSPLHSNTTHPEQKDCVHLMKAGSSFVWLEDSCSSIKPYICRYDNQQETSTVVGSYGAGILVFPGLSIQQPVLLTPVSDFRTSPLQTVLLPGLWFANSGQLDSWNFSPEMTKDTVSLTLLILRPFCAAGMYLMRPGCANNPLPYSICQPNPSQCGAVYRCPIRSQYCHLSSNCTEWNEPCTCSSTGSTASGCSSQPLLSEFSQLAPQYEVISAESVRLIGGRGAYIIPSQTSKIMEGDILAFQHDSSSGTGIKCNLNANSAWKQSIFIWSSTSWAQVGSVVTLGSDTTQSNDVVCLLRAKYFTPTISPVPSILSHVNSAGVYTYSVEVTDGVNSNTETCQIKAEEKVGGLELISPHIVGPGSSKGSIGTIPVEFREITTIVVRVFEGSHLRAVWDHLGASKELQFSPNCPGSLALSPKCSSNSSRSSTPFSSITLRLDTNSPLSSLSITVKNDISSTALRVDLAKAFSIKGFSVKLGKAQRHKVDSTGNILVPTDESIKFRATLTQGSGVKYRWAIENVENFTSTRTNTFAYMFGNPGEYLVASDAFNVINTVTNKFQVLAVKLADFTNLTSIVFTDIVERNQVLSLTFEAGVQKGADVKINMDFGDGFVDPEKSLVTTTTTLVIQVTHVYINIGRYHVNLTLSDAFESSSIVRNISVINPLLGAQLTTTQTALPMSMPAAFHLKVSGSDLGEVWHTWNFGDGQDMNYNGENSIVRHTYKEGGSHSVVVNIFNGVSSLTKTLNITVEEEITGLALHYDGPKASHLSIEFSIVLTTGTYVSFNISTGDRNSFESSLLTFSHLYAEAGAFNVTVWAWNQVSNAKISIPVYALGADMLEVVAILAPKCTVTGTSANLTAETINTAPVALFYTWIFGDGKNHSATDEAAVLHSYSSPGTYQVFVYVNNTVKSKSAEARICVQDIVKGVQISSQEAVGFSRGSKAESNVTVTVQSGSNVSYRWESGLVGSNATVVCARCVTSFYVFSFSAVGEYTVSVTVSNNVSSVTRKIKIRVQQKIENVKLLCTNCKKSMYLALQGASSNLNLYAQTSYGSSVTYSWTIDNGSPVISADSYYTAKLTHVKIYTVVVTAMNDVNNMTDTLVVEVQEFVSNLRIAANATEVLAGNAIEFVAEYNKGSELTFQWTVCPNCVTKSTGVKYIHPFISSGEFEVRLEAKNKVSEAHAKLKIYSLNRITEVVVNSNLKGNFVSTGQNVAFNVSVNEQTQANLTWTITLSNIPILTTVGEHISYDFPKIGYYNVAVSVFNSLSSGFSNMDIIAEETIVDFNLTYMPQKNILSVQDSLNLTAHTSSGSHVQTSWHAANSSEKWVLPFSSNSVTVTFFTAGATNITCNMFNHVSSLTKTITILVQVPIFDIEIEGLKSTSFLASGETLTFKASVTSGSDLSFDWYLNDTYRPQAHDKTFVHTFNIAGIFQVDLIAQNDVSQATTRKIIIVQSAIKDLSIAAPSMFVQTNVPVHFSPRVSSGSDIRFKWILSDQVNQTVLYLENVTHTYTSPGSFSVRLEAYNNVSIQDAEYQITSQDPVRDVFMKDCCGGIFESKIQLSFTASVTGGTSMRYSQEIVDPANNILCRSDQETIKCIFPDSGLYTLKVQGMNEVSDNSRIYIVSVQSRLKEISIQPDGLGWDYLYQGHAVIFTVSGSGVDDAEDFVWKINGIIRKTRIPELKHVFTQEGNYSMAVTVKNKINLVTYTTIARVHTFLCEMPLLIAVGDTSRRIFPSYTAELEVIVNPGNCTLYAAKHEWRIIKGECSGPLVEILKLPSDVYKNGPLLKIPKHFLTSGTFCAEFRSGYEEIVITKKVQYLLTVESNPLVAIINGGDERIVPNNQSVILDGSPSYDPDNSTTDTTRISYQWTCSVSKSQIDQSQSPCFSVMFGKVVHVAGGRLLPGHVYVITLTISLSECGSNCKNSTTKQYIHVSPDPVPVVLIECLSCRVTNNFQISSNQHVALRGNHQNFEDDGDGEVRYLWTVRKVLNGALLGTELQLDSKITTTGSNASDLVIRRGVLENGHDYSFLLQVTHFTGSVSLKGHASLTLKSKAPPFGGMCSVDPSDGKVILLETLVTVSCYNWTDVEAKSQGLFYRTSLEKNLPSGKSEQHILYHGQRPQHSVYLAHWPGDSSNGLVTVRVDIEDKSGRSVTALRKVVQLLLPTLDPNQSFSDYMATTALQKLKTLVRLHQPSTLLQYSGAVLVELNGESRVANSSLKDATKRTILREALVTVMNSIPIQSVEDIQQLSFALEQSIMVESDQLSTRSKMILGQIAGRLLKRIESLVQQGMDSEDFFPLRLLTIVSSLMQVEDAHNTSLDPVSKPGLEWNMKDFTLSSNGEQPPKNINELQTSMALITDCIGFSESIMSLILKTQLRSEHPTMLQLENIQMMGQRTSSNGIWTKRSAAGCQFVLPESLLSELPTEEEIFQIMFVMPQNPFKWGYQSSFAITSQVPSLIFQYSNGSEIPIMSLPVDNQVQVSMYSSQTQMTNADMSAMEETSTNFDKKSIILSPDGSKKVILNTSLASDYKSSSLHVYVRCISLAKNDTTRNMTSSDVCKIYLGVDYEPSSSKYEDMMIMKGSNLTLDGDQSHTFFIRSSEFKPNSQYLLALFNPSSNESVQIEVGLYMSSCQYYSPSAQLWDSTGCEVEEMSRPDRTQCCCNHLTSFGASAIVPPNAIDFADLGNLSLSSNPVALILCCVLFGVYLMLLAVCRRKDLKEIRHISQVPLCGLDGSHKYEVTVVTGRHFTAGTTANVGIKLIGEEGKSGRRLLSKPKAFQRNSQDTFLIANDTSLGKLWKVVIWHDNDGLNPSWYLVQIVVRDLQTDSRFLFMANCWLSLEEEDGFIQKEIIVSDPRQRWGFSQLCRSALSRGLSDHHLWISVYDRPAQSRFSRVQRLSCCFTLLYTYMAANIMWYGALKSTPEQDDINEWTYFSWEEIVVGTISSLIAFPINIIIAYMFRKTRSKETVFDWAQKPQTAETIEIPNECDQNIDSSQRQRPDLFDRESTQYTIPLKRDKAFRRTNTLRKLPSEPSEASFSHTISDTDSGVGSNKGKILKSEETGWWTVDTIIKHWDISNSNEEKNVRDSGVAIDRSLRMSGIKVDESNSDDDDWLSNLDDLDYAENRKRQNELTREWSLDDIDDEVKWREIRAEICEDKPSSPKGKSKVMIELQELPKSGTSFDGKTFNPRSEASISGETTLRRRSLGSLTGPSQTVPQLSHVNLTTQNSRESTFDSVQGNILFGRERSKTMSSITSKKGKSRKMSVASRLSQRLNRALLPRWCLYLAYAMCFVLCGISVLLILLYANQLKTVGTWKWIVSLILSFLLSALITEPLKVLFLAIFAATVTKQVDEVDDAIEIEPKIESNEKYKDVKFRPLGGYALLNARENAKKLKRMYQLIKQCLMYVTLIWLVMVIAHISFNSHLYQRNRHLKQVFLQTKFDSSHRFTDIESVSMFWSWCDRVLAPQLNDSGNHIYLGAVRLRQIRSVPKPCPASSLLSSYANTPEWSNQCNRLPHFTEDREVFETTDGTLWEHQSVNDLDELAISLKTQWYEGSGYTYLLQPDVNNTQERLSWLGNISWIDEKSRAVFVEGSVYNPSLDMMSSFVLAVEFPFTGKAVPSFEVESFFRLKYTPGSLNALMFFQILLLFVWIYFLVHCILGIYRAGWGAMRSITTWSEILIIICMLSSLILYLLTVLTSTATINKYLTDTSSFTSFRKTAFVHGSMRCSNAALVLLLLVKIVQQFRFSKFLSLFQKTMTASMEKILGAFFIFLCLLIIYAEVGYLVYGSSVYGFHTFQSSVLSVVGVIRGRIEFTPFLVLHTGMSYLYFYSLTLLVYGMVFGLILAILRDVYKLTHSQMFYKQTVEMEDHEVIEFMMKRFLLIAGFRKQKPAFRKVRFPGLPSLSSHSTSSFPSSKTTTQSSSSSDSFGLDCLEGGSNGTVLDQLPARWEDVLMKMRQLEEMDDHEENVCGEICSTIEANRRACSPELRRKSPDLATKPPRAPRARAMSDSKNLKLFLKPRSKWGRKSVSPPDSVKTKPEDRRPHSDQGARTTSDNREQKAGLLTRIFKKAW